MRVNLTREIAYNYLIDYTPENITELMHRLSLCKEELIIDALTYCLGLSVKTEDKQLITVVYDGFHYVYYQHIKIGYLRTIFNSHNIVIEFNSIPP